MVMALSYANLGVSAMAFSYHRNVGFISSNWRGEISAKIVGW